MEAEKKTSAEIVVVVACASDGYQSYVLLTGLVFGSLLAGIFWAYGIVIAFPWLLIVQMLGILLFSVTPFLRKFCVHFVPKQILHRRAAHRAYEEYLAVSQKVSAATPLVIFYISLAERYAHILPSRMVREKIADEIWGGVVAEFTAAIPQKGLQDACVAAIGRMSGLLSPCFPHGNEQNAISDKVITV